MNAPDAIFEGLTAPQREAAGHVDGPLLVLAGPGSGKTTVVTRRVAHLVAQGIPAWQILALTFTNKAAGEMRERIDRLVPEDVPGRRGLTVATFHAFCARMLRTYGDLAGLTERFSIYDTADQRVALKQAIAAAELSERNFTPAAVGGAISAAKNRLLDAAGFAVEANDFYQRSIARAYTSYEKILRSNDALDFDDLLLVTARLLRSDARVREALQERYQYLLVDEYQDTNHAQFVIASALASRHRNLCVVGDPDQSIYGWRGADISNILEFEQQYPEAKVIPLGQNFRSTGHIVHVADGLIRRNAHRKHKPLHTELEDGDKPAFVVCRDEIDEAEMLVREFRGRHHEEGVPWKDMAVLYRMNALSRVLEDAFRGARIPYVIARGTAFYERREIKDALAYLRLIANPSDEVSLRRIINTPPRGIGKTTLDRIELHAMERGLRFFDALREADRVDGLAPRAVGSVMGFVRTLEAWLAHAQQDAPPDATGLLVASVTAPDGDRPATPEALGALVERVVRESGMETQYRKSPSDEDMERLENLAELVSAAVQFEPTTDPGAPGAEALDPEWSLLDRLHAFLESVALVSDADVIDPERGAVTLMTLHAAKGLEFDTVAIAGLEHGLLPHHRAAESDMELEEERRLLFVGITRAKRSLMLSRAAVRTQRGIRERTIESQFVRELPADSIVKTDLGGGDWDAVDDDPFVRDDDGRNFTRRGGGRSALLSAFPSGTLVRHPMFGLGRVDSVTPRPMGSSARVTFDTVGTKTLILEYAKLERVE